MMSKELLPYEQELALIKLGYRQSDLLTGYTSEGLLDFTGILYQQAFRWFREVHGLVHDHTWMRDHNWDFEVTNVKTGITVACTYGDTYEEAELACLKKLIEIVKEKQDDNI